MKTRTKGDLKEWRCSLAQWFRHSLHTFFKRRTIARISGKRSGLLARRIWRPWLLNQLAAETPTLHTRAYNESSGRSNQSNSSRRSRRPLKKERTRRSRAKKNRAHTHWPVDNAYRIYYMSARQENAGDRCSSAYKQLIIKRVSRRHKQSTGRAPSRSWRARGRERKSNGTICGSVYTRPCVHRKSINEYWNARVPQWASARCGWGSNFRKRVHVEGSTCVYIYRARVCVNACPN